MSVDRRVNPPVPTADHRQRGLPRSVDVFGLLWERKHVLAGGTLLAGAVAFILSSLATPVYESTVVLRVAEPMVVQEDSPRPTNAVAGHVGLLRNRSSVAEAVAEFGLDEPPYSLHPLTFIAAHLEVEPVDDSGLVTLTVKLPSPILAAEVANRLAELAVEKEQELERFDAIDSKSFIQQELDAARRRLEEAESQLLEVRTQSQLELMRVETDALVRQSGSLVDLLIDISAEQARLMQIEEELAGRDRIVTMIRSIDDDAVLTELARSADVPVAELLDIQLRSEFIDPVYRELDQQFATSKTRLAELEQRHRDLVDDLGLGAPQISQLTLLYETETRLARLETEYELAQTHYRDLARLYDRVRIEVASRSTRLQILDPAIPPLRAVSPRTRLNVILAVLAGLALTTLAIVAAGLFARSEAS